jgi:DNA-binding transcriptional LysR family regulator
MSKPMTIVKDFVRGEQAADELKAAAKQYATNIERIYAQVGDHIRMNAELAARHGRDALLAQHRAVAVADSISRGSGLTIGLLGGQDVFTVPDMQSKLEAQLRGLGGGFLPESLARPYIQTGQLVVKQVLSVRHNASHYAWRDSPQAPAGQALRWWLAQLAQPATRQALLQPTQV